jgi:hypothetical protein
MPKRRSRKDKEKLDELVSTPGQSSPDSAGQSGDAQGLSAGAEAADQSVEELAETEQAYEAGIVEGVEEAGDNPERPVYTHEHPGRPEDSLPDETGDSN